MAVMAKEKPEAGQGRHKNKGMVLRLHDSYWQQLEALVERNQSDFTEEIRAALRAYLAANDLWPPPARK